MNASRRSECRRGRRTYRAVSFLLPVLAACAGLIAAGTAAAQSAAPAGNEAKGHAKEAKGKRVLFDGKTLDGWKKADFHGTGEVLVQGGRIVLTTGTPMTGVTTTRTDLPKTDYELTYEAMRTAGEDFFAAATFPVGDSYITLVNGGWGGHVTGLSSLDGMDASENETTHTIKYENNTWYRFRVRVTGEVIRCWVGDREVAAIKYAERHVGTRVETRASQPLGFAAWKSGGAIRAVEVRPLSPEEIAATNKVEE
ncbi:MAG: 3-keto-disaccharide hydrolase [Isosphaeraceae bacterium]